MIRLERVKCLLIPNAYSFLLTLSRAAEAFKCMKGNLCVNLSASRYREERKTYYKHRQKARSQPQKYVTIIIDGMDQSKTNVPYFSRRTKSTQNLWHLQTHITGALVHTQSPTGKKAFAFVDLYQYPHDSNLTLNVLLQLLLQSAEVLPSVLYLQLDNCFRENKNRFILAFCAALVQKKIFKKVRLKLLCVFQS